MSKRFAPPFAPYFAALLLVLAAQAAFAEGTAEAPADGALPEWQATGAEDRGDPRVVTSLYVDAAAVAPGDTVRVGVRFEMDPEWHVYWRNPGQAALSTEVTFASDAAEFGELQWPAPEVFQQNNGFITTYGYGHDVVLFTEATVAEDVSGELVVTAIADYLTCKVDCIPGRNEMTRRVPIAAAAAPAEASVADWFDEAAAQVPIAPGRVGWRVDAQLDHDVVRPGDELLLAVAATPAGRCDEDGELPCVPVDASTEAAFTFIPDRVSQLTVTAAAVNPHPTAQHGLVATAQLRAGIDPVADDQTLGGVLYVQTANGGPRWAFDVSIPIPRADADAERTAIEHPFFLDIDLDALPEDVTLSAAPATPPAPPAPTMPLPRLLLLAFIGGMILNLMPCVLPVLGIKATSFVRLVHEDKQSVLGHAGAYTGGIVASMGLLAGVVIALRAGGTAVGWGFQLQHPAFVAVLAIVVVFFAAALLGAWDFGVTAAGLDRQHEKSHGVRRSFLEGVLAVVLATPCSAPVLGSAVGFALTAKAWMIALTFVVIGLGLAAPFVAVVTVPGLRRFIPRPGSWMVAFERILGFTLILTAVWLVWLCGQLTGTAGMVVLVATLVVTGAIAWATGRAQRTGRRAIPMALGGLAALSAGVAFALPDAPPPSADDHAPGVVAWSPETVAAEVAAGRTVFVDFTADWCITCKVNERTVLADARVQEAFAEHDIAFLVGDWTRRDEAIRAELERYGKAGVPLYVVHRPGEAPEVLPELLTVGRVLSAVGADS